MVCMMTEPSSRVTSRIVLCVVPCDRISDALKLIGSTDVDDATVAAQAPSWLVKINSAATDRYFITGSLVKIHPERTRACPCYQPIFDTYLSAWY